MQEITFHIRKSHFYWNTRLSPVDRDSGGICSTLQLIEVRWDAVALLLVWWRSIAKAQLQMRTDPIITASSWLHKDLQKSWEELPPRMLWVHWLPVQQHQCLISCIDHIIPSKTTFTFFPWKQTRDHKRDGGDPHQEEEDFRLWLWIPEGGQRSGQAGFQVVLRAPAGPTRAADLVQQPSPEAPCWPCSRNSSNPTHILTPLTPNWELILLSFAYLQLTVSFTGGTVLYYISFFIFKCNHIPYKLISRNSNICLELWSMLLS